MLAVIIVSTTDWVHVASFQGDFSCNELRSLLLKGRKLGKKYTCGFKKNITEMIIFLLTIGERAFSIISGGGNPFFSDGI